MMRQLAKRMKRRVQGRAFRVVSGATCLALILALASVILPPEVALADDTGWTSPNSNAVGAGNGFESNPQRAYADEAPGYAFNYRGPGDSHAYYGYDLSSIPNDATINGIEVRLDWWVNNTYGSESIDVHLSWDGGASWTAARTASTERDSDGNPTDVVGSPTDTWDRTWSKDDFSINNFRVGIVCNSGEWWKSFYLDWVPVRVTYEEPEEVWVDKTATCTSGGCVTYDVTLTIDGFNVDEPTDMMLVFDRSGSMDDGPGDEPIDTAKDAANTFIDLLGSDDYVGLVSYATTATEDSGLTTDHAAVKTLINGLNANGKTNMDHAISLAKQELDDNGRADTPKAIIVLSDGVANRTGPGGSGSDECGEYPCYATSSTGYDPDDRGILCTDDAIAEAQAAKDAGYMVFSIFLENVNGSDCDNEARTEQLGRETLKDVSSGEADYYFETPDADDLEAIYRKIAGLLSPGSTNILVTDVVSEEFVIVPNTLSATRGTATYIGQTITWTLGTLAEETETLTYQVTAKAEHWDTGPLPVNDSATMDYDDADGNPQTTLSFPVPTVDIPCGEACIVVYKEADCGGETGCEETDDFDFTTVALDLETFTLDDPEPNDDDDISNVQEMNLADDQVLTFDVTEGDPGEWKLQDIVCSGGTVLYGDSDDDPGSFDGDFDGGDDTARVTLAQASDCAMCVFTNGYVGGTAITVSAVAARSGMGGLTRLLWLGLALVLTGGGFVWTKRRNS